MAFGAILDSLTETGLLERWWTASYEPEILAFGGARAIFHWNRLGLPATTQAILARATRDAVLNPPRASARRTADGR